MQQMTGKLSLKNLTNWNNLFFAVLGVMGASLLAIVMVQTSNIGSYLSIAVGVVFCIVTSVLAMTEPDECIIRTSNWSEKVVTFVCFNRKVIMLILMITSLPLIGIGVATLASAQYPLYTALIGFALLAISALYILRVPDSLDGRMGMRPKEMKSSPPQMRGSKRRFSQEEENFDEEAPRFPKQKRKFREQEPMDVIPSEEEAMGLSEEEPVIDEEE